jgi:hypothetical protein
MNPRLRTIRKIILLLISESDPDGPGCANHASFRIHKSHFADGLIESDGFNFTGTEANHSPEFSARNELDGFNAKARCQDAIKRAGRSAALNVTEHGHSNILLQKSMDRIANHYSHLAGARGRKPLFDEFRLGQLHAFCYNDQ